MPKSPEKLSWHVDIGIPFLNFSTMIFIGICWPLVAKLKNQKMFKMTVQVSFISKNVQRFSLVFLEASNLNKSPDTLETLGAQDTKRTAK